MSGAIRAVFVAGIIAVCSLASAGEGVRVLVGFEWEDFQDGTIAMDRREFLGEPHTEGPAPGWRGTEIEKLEDVGPDGFMVISRRSSRDWPQSWMVRTHATQGQFAWRCRWTEARWNYIAAQLKREHPGPWPARESIYDAHDHFFQRETQLWRQDWAGLTDWSGFERLRFEVTAVGQPVKVGVRVRDGSGPRVRNRPTGIRTEVAVFVIPADRTVTCDVPLAELARLAELDLTRVHRYNIRLNGLPSGEPPTDLYLDNVRLVAEGAEPEPEYPLIEMEGEPRPFARPVDQTPPLERDPAKLERNEEPVEPLGPVVINRGAPLASGAGHMPGPTHFGWSGATYFQHARRAVIAYDNDRLLVVMAGRGEANGGLIAIASFDGGETWEAPDREGGDYTVLPWYMRAGYFADRYGNAFGVGTPNCDSYNEGQDIALHRLAFLGDRWVKDRFAIVHQDGYKCPAQCRAIQLENGRLWASWTDGFGGSHARHSDDDGYTWAPCKDAAEEPERLFYSPDLADLGEPDAPEPPKRVLLWPTPVVVGPMIVPYKDSVAVVGGGQWQVHDGEKWLEPERLPDLGRGLLTVTALGNERVFIARGAGYSNRGDEVLADDLVVLHGKDGDWTKDTLAEGRVGSAIVTASGDAVYCFYVMRIDEPDDDEDGEENGQDPEYEVRYRRWKDGTWEEPVTLSTERQRINHLAAPQYSPASYAALFWDYHVETRADPSEVKFVRVPNR